MSRGVEHKDREKQDVVASGDKASNNKEPDFQSLVAVTSNLGTESYGEVDSFPTEYIQTGDTPYHVEDPSGFTPQS
jgi:hypothetical protein